MGTRSGSIDPMLVEFLAHKEGLTLEQVGTLLNKQSGLLGLSGMTDDMRELLEEEAESKDRRATLAIDVFCSRARQAVGGLVADMGGADAVVFSGGIGSGSPEIRRRICDGLDCLGLTLDPERNAAGGGASGEVSAEGSRMKAYALPTNEEILIARDTLRVVEGLPFPT
jgi:acetate kinase